MPHCPAARAAAVSAAALLVAPASADQIEDIIDQVTVEEHLSYLRVLTGVDPVPGEGSFHLTNRYSYGDDIHVAADWILDHFASLGLDASLHEFDPAYGPNVIGELAGNTHPEDVYVICGHYDTYRAANQYDAPGCDDNGSGTAAVMMAARILSRYRFEGTIRFIAFAGEEQWMVGSEAYARDAYLRGENIVAAINLDMFLHPGWDNQSPDPDYDLDIGGNASSQWIAQLLAAMFAAYTPIDYQVHEDDGFVSDQWGFWQWGYDAVGLIENTPDEIWGGSNDAYHQGADVIDDPDYDWEFGRHAIRGSMAALIDLAALIPCPADVDGDGQVAFADLLRVLQAWGPCGGCPEDLDEDGLIGFSEVLTILSAWGSCD